MSVIIPLHKYQEKWFRDRSPNKVGCWPRQSGKTLTTSAEIVDDCVAKIIAGERATWYIVSRSYDQSILALEYCKRFLKAYEITFEYFESNLDSLEDVVREIRLPHGGRIRAMPSKPESLRGPSGCVYLDEFDIRSNDLEFWAATMPITSVPGCRTIVTSTPGGHGPNGLFYDFLTAPDLSGTWSRHQLDIYECVRQGLDRDPEALRIKLRDPVLWEREYLCKFVVGSSVWFPPELYLPCLDKDAGIPELYQGGPCYVGVDIGWSNDLWVAWVIERLASSMLFTREVLPLEPSPDKHNRFAIQEAALENIMSFYDVRKLSIDATGIGKKPVEDAIRAYGEWRVEGVDMSNSRQYELAITGRQAMEHQFVRIPSDPSVTKDLQKIRRTQTATGKPSFRAQRDKDGHADRSWAYMLAVYSAQLPNLIDAEFGQASDIYETIDVEAISLEEHLFAF